MNEVQINKIKKRADEYATSFFPYEKQFLEREAVVKCCVHVVTETIAELEKENAELKEDNSEWEKASDKWKSVYELTNNQLANAKEIIREFMKYEINEYDGSLEIHFEELKKQAEQFLSEVEK